MTLKLTRGLWLWAGALALTLLLVIPLTAGVRAVAALAIVLMLVWGWVRTGRRFAWRGRQLLLAGDMALPPAGYRKPVVLVCGDGLAGLFGELPAEQLVLRTTAQGCYVCVPVLDQLVSITASIQARRPDWAGQLCVMFIANPAEHTDSAALGGRVRAFRHQVALVRKRGVALPLMLVSYLQATKGEGAWFSWESGQTSPYVSEAGASVSLFDWQGQATNGATYAERLCSGVQISSASTWLPTRNAEGISALVKLLAPDTEARVTPHWPQKVALVQPASLSKRHPVSLSQGTPLGSVGVDANSQLHLALFTEDLNEARGWLPGGLLHNDLLVLLRVYLGWRCTAKLQLSLPINSLPSPVLGGAPVLLGMTGVLGLGSEAWQVGEHETITINLGRYQGLHSNPRFREAQHVAYHF